MDVPVLVISAMLQFLAAAMALRLVHITRHRLAWVSVALAVLLMGLRQSITLYRIFADELSGAPDIMAEVVGLPISVLMVVGLSRIGPIFSDIKHSAEQAETNRTLLQAILDHTPAVVCIKDLEGRYLVANREAERLAGRTLVGYRDAELFPPEVALHFTEHDRQVTEEGKSEEYDEILVLPDGSERHYMSVKFCLTDARGECYGMCGIATDVTARRRAEAESRALDIQLQRAQKLESLGVLAGGIAHDFNNLLVAILGNVDLAMRFPNQDPRVKDDLLSAQSAAQSAAGLCRQLLIYAGRGRIEVAPVHLSELVQKVTRLMGASTSKNIQIKTELDAALPLVEADETQLMQVIMNFVVNAADAIGERPGTISITTKKVTLSGHGLQDLVAGHELERGDYACFEVKDDGCGMDEVTRGRLFEPFFTTKFTGRGLGLSAAGGIVSGHEGAITLETSPGQGARFRLYLPLPENDLGKPTESSLGPGRSSEPRGALVMVVDDEPVVRRMAEKALERAGYSVILAEGGEAAVEMFRSRHRDVRLVFLDLTMPEMDGEETFRALQTVSSQVKVVIVSGYDQVSMGQRPFVKETLGFLPKPFTASELTAWAAKVLA